MPIEAYRIDDRLVHGQVVVGWGQPLALGFIVLVDDQVAESAWEQDLYRMGVPPEMKVHFESVAGALSRLPAYRLLPSPGLLLLPAWKVLLGMTGPPGEHQRSRSGGRG